VPGINTFAAADPRNKVTIVVWVNLDPTPDGRAAATLIAKSLIDEMYASPTPTSTR
jgi:D-alanyl-D-alanine carboxypeptidase